jgi:predicted GNAT superfamily acetyltransferase
VALSVGDDEEPIERPRSGDVVLACVPEDIVELRRRDEDLGHRWRLALRKVLGTTLHDGYATIGMSRSGYYVLQRGA